MLDILGETPAGITLERLIPSCADRLLAGADATPKDWTSFVDLVRPDDLGDEKVPNCSGIRGWHSVRSFDADRRLHPRLTNVELLESSWTSDRRPSLSLTVRSRKANSGGLRRLQTVDWARRGVFCGSLADRGAAR